MDQKSTELTRIYLIVRAFVVLKKGYLNLNSVHAVISFFSFFFNNFFNYFKSFFFFFKKESKKEFSSEKVNSLLLRKKKHDVFLKKFYRS